MEMLSLIIYLSMEYSSPFTYIYKYEMLITVLLFNYGMLISIYLFIDGNVDHHLLI